jgi:hypothetical protein
MAVKSRIGARKLRPNFQLNFIRNLDARATRVEGRCWPRVDGRSVRSVCDLSDERILRGVASGRN